MDGIGRSSNRRSSIARGVLNQLRNGIHCKEMSSCKHRKCWRKIRTGVGFKAKRGDLLFSVPILRLCLSDRIPRAAVPKRLLPTAYLVLLENVLRLLYRFNAVSLMLVCAKVALPYQQIEVTQRMPRMPSPGVTSDHPAALIPTYNFRHFSKGGGGRVVKGRK